MSKKEALAEYHSKRDFSRTAEPRGRKRHSRQQERFVVQKHAARGLHYDFRLETEGVLKSWSVPKGPSTDPRDKRLAVPTEDHPIEYAEFEGIISQGQYGAGAVIVWDTGTYDNLTTDKDGAQVPVGTAVERGHVTVRLNGRKLHGGYALTRIRESAWLLVKTADEAADARRDPVSSQPQSVRSGRTLEELAEKS
ncbi:DNA polymerase ligase N-terminal domain-containing protein [Nonomuraea sp. 10N515B]|uniref:DNA polymerase ligase N-terminal domain-containing protein n=1 Tax=Nonomuraea sp. 10N515B TaxID=3457422 RepID=UPI003FCDD308